MIKTVLKHLIPAMALGLGLSFASLAATGWVADGNIWRYYKADGELLTDSWKKSGNDFYWLDENGEMAVDSMIEVNGDLYYVDENGCMARNRWVQVAADDSDLEAGAEFRWYYFKGDGKAVKNKKKYLINGHYYGFDQDGKMLFGFVQDGNILIEDEAVLDADYYYGEPEDGAMYTGWLHYSDFFLPDTYYDRDITDVWFYFTPNGQKATKTRYPNGRNINGLKYQFDDYGIMKGDWSGATATNGGSSAQYFNGFADGHQQKKGWFKAIPSKELSVDDYNDEVVRTFYSKGNGYTIVNAVKKIDGAWYAFDTIGRKCTGILGVIAPYGRLEHSKLRSTTVLTDWTIAKVMSLDPAKDEYVAYFDEKGAYLNKTKEFSFKDGRYTVRVGKNGLGINGVYKNKLYVNGILQCTGKDTTSDDGRKWQLRYNLYGKKGEYAAYIVDNNGNILKKNGAYKDNEYGMMLGIHFFSGGTCSIVWIDDINADALKAAKEYARTGDLGEYASKVTLFEQRNIAKITSSFDDSLVSDGDHSKFVDQITAADESEPDPGEIGG